MSDLSAAAEDGSASKIQKSNPLGVTVAKCLGATVSYPMLLLKTRRQVSSTHYSYRNMSGAIMRYEGFRGFYKGFGTCFLGYITAQALQIAAFKITQRKVRTKLVELGFPNSTVILVANAAAAVTSVIPVFLVRTPSDVVSQRLMVQTSVGGNILFPNLNSENYRNALDVFRKILRADGPRGLYRGFGISIVSCLTSGAIWLTSYSMVYRFLCGSLMGGKTKTKREEESNTIANANASGFSSFRPDSKATVAAQGLSAVVASGVSAIVTMPLNTIKTRLQVLDTEENGRRRPLTFMRTVRNLVNEGGVLACYRGLGPRLVSTSILGATTITSTAYVFLKQRSTKSRDNLN